MRFLAVNNSWQLAPWADILYGCDLSWWQKYPEAHRFAGMKLSQNATATRQFPYIRKVSAVGKCDRLLFDRKGVVGSGGNGGFQALNLTAQFGVWKIILVGFDMRIDRGHHWHGSHPSGMKNPTETTVRHWRAAVDGAAPALAARGILVVNASLHSALTAYPKLPFEDAIAWALNDGRRSDAPVDQVSEAH